LKELRGNKTQAAIASELKTNQQTYARWELGDRQPKLQDLASIALHFGVSSDWLLGLSIHPVKHKNALSACESLEGYEAVCKKCVEKDRQNAHLKNQVDRLERVVDKLTK